MTIIRGHDCTLTIEGNEVIRARGVDLNVKGGDIDATSRSTDGWKERRVGLLEWDATFDIVRETGDSVYTTLKAAFLNKTQLTAVFAEPAGGDSLTGECEISDFSRSEPLNDVAVIKITLIGTGALV